MPTRGRSELARQALECFWNQTYSHRELIVLDDAERPSFPGGIAMDGVKYLRLEETLNIPQKRNKCCELAQGQAIAHFDSDDWSAPERLQTQMDVLQRSGLSVTGFHSILFYDMTNKRAHSYSYKPDFALGTSLVYTKQWWEANRWKENKSIASDNSYVGWAGQRNQLVTSDSDGLMVARIHGENTSGKPTSRPPYKQVPLDRLPIGFPR